MLFKNQKSLKTRLALILLLLGGISGTIFAYPVRAATLIVTNTNDNGTGSLRQAVMDAGSGDTITFDPSLAGQTIALTSEINLNKNLTIDASDLEPTVELSGILASRIFYVSSNTTVNLLSLLLKDGRSVSASGGAIYSEGNLVVSKSTFINNIATTSGGAIFGSFSMDVSNSTFVSNSAQSGGAIYLAGGIFSNPESQRTIVNSTFVSNQADPVNGQGGGVFNYGSDGFQPSGNPFVLSNNTFSGNGANVGGNLYNWGSMSFNNNILANNTSGGDCYSMVSIYPIITYGVNNLIEDGVSCSQGTFISGDPLLGSLADNGGPTMTMALPPGSPAIDAGTAACVPTDQRGVTRPQGAACEIGAYEYEYQTVIYHVKWNASGANNGTSWTHAFTDLQSALAAASTGDQIWVAAGSYKPTLGTDRTISFALKNGVAIYGGFAGTETLLSQRNYEANLTILSGDIGAGGANSDNSYHVVVGSNTNNYARLDGFMITGGNANGSGEYGNGGAIYNANGNPTWSNLIIRVNSGGIGTGIYNYNSNPTLTNIVFASNFGFVGSRGGALVNDFNSSPTLTNVLFLANTDVSIGGAMLNSFGSNPYLENVTFLGNSASTRGGAIYNWESNPTLINVTFSENSATYGGAISNDSNSHTTIINSILYGDTGGEIDNFSGTAAVSYSIVQGGYIGEGNLDMDPLLGPLQENGGFTPTMALLAGSPAIDSGSDANCPATDQRGVTRPQGSHCDMGAYEYVFPPTPTPTKTPKGASPTPANTATRTITPTSTPITPTGTHTFTPHPPTVTFTPSPTTTATNVVNVPAQINKSFTPTIITAGGISRLSVFIFNPNPFALTSASLVDNLPAGITIANLVSLSNLCGGTVTALSGGTSFSLIGGTVPAQVGSTPGSCTVAINVTSSTPGNFINTIPAGALSTGNGITNTTAASASLMVLPSTATYTATSLGTPTNTPKGQRTNTPLPTATSTRTPTTLTITSDNPDPSETNQSVTVSVIVSGGSPTGVVDLTGADTNCLIILNNGTGSCVVTFTTSGTKTINAFYNGDAAHFPSSDVENHTVVSGVPTFTRTPTATFTATATRTASPTITATSSSGFPITVVRDNFNRANGAIGTSWSGYPASFSIASNQLDVTATGSNTFILWNSASFGADQEAYVTLTQLDTTATSEHRLILKSQSNKNVTAGQISVRYDAVGQTVQVWTYHSTQGWVQYGANIPVVFVNGDQFGARARPDGTVEIYRNGTLLATRSITAWPFYANGGYIGLWLVNAPGALLDNFGGGTR